MSYIGNPRKGFSVGAYNRQKANRFPSLIKLARAELREYGFITERTIDRLRLHGIDPVKVERGYADE